MHTLSPDRKRLRGTRQLDPSGLKFADGADRQALLLAMIHDAIAHLVNPVHRLSDARPILERIERLLETGGHGNATPGFGVDLLSLIAPSGLKRDSLAVALVARDYRLVAVSEAACTLLGYNKEQLLQSKAVDFVHHDDLWLAVVQVQTMFSGKIPGFSMEVRALRPDGTDFPVRVSVQALRRPDNIEPELCIVLMEPPRASDPKPRTNAATFGQFARLVTPRARRTSLRT